MLCGRAATESPTGVKRNLHTRFLRRRRAKESYHQKRSNVVNTRFCVAIAAATKNHIALPKDHHHTVVLLRTLKRATRLGRRCEGESYRACGCRNAVGSRHAPPFASIVRNPRSAKLCRVGFRTRS